VPSSSVRRRNGEPRCLADSHLALIHGEAHPSPYAVLDTEVCSHIKLRLRRSSDFFAQVVCPFMIRDIGILLDKHGSS